jgi:secondary thiamine-phosphate synthase enzyme
VPSNLSHIRVARAETIASATLSVETPGEGFVEITREVARFLRDSKACDGAVLLFLRHTSASLVIQENADPDVRTDLVTALKRVAPPGAGWVHQVEGPDDMPAHIKSMLNGVSLHVPVADGEMTLGTWQGIYLAEHRARPHRREVMLQFIGACSEN